MGSPAAFAHTNHVSKLSNHASPSVKLLSRLSKYIVIYSHSVCATVIVNCVQFSSVSQLCSTLCDPMECSTTGPPVHHQLPEFTQTYVYWVGDAIQPSHPLSSPPPPTFNLSPHQGLFHWVSSLHLMAKVLEFQPQHQSFQWTLKTYLL